MKRTLCLLLACLMVLPLFASCDKETGTNPQTTTANTAQTTEATTVDPDKPNIPSAEEIGDISGDFHILVSGNWAWNDYASEGEEGTVIESAIYKRNQNMYENYGINITTEDVAAYQTAMGNGTGYKKVYTAYMSGDDIYNATMIGAYDVATLTYNGSLRIRLLHYSVLERERRIFGSANITIGGTASVSVLHGSATSAKGSELGDVKIKITDNAQIRTIYGATAALNVNSYEITWESGTIGDLQWNCASTSAANLTVNGLKVLRASDKVKAYANYSTIAALFDKVIGVDESVETVVKVEAPTIRSDYGCARALYALGLAQGYDTTGTNFGLGDKMTRAQMIVQVIRFLGVEDEVKAGSYKHPFTDVPAWANNYIGYAYTNGITSGVSATKFNPLFCFLCCMARATLPKRVRSFLCAVMTETARVRSQPVCSV